MTGWETGKVLQMGDASVAGFLSAVNGTELIFILVTVMKLQSDLCCPELKVLLVNIQRLSLSKILLEPAVQDTTGVA